MRLTGADIVQMYLWELQHKETLRRERETERQLNDDKGIEDDD